MLAFFIVPKSDFVSVDKLILNLLSFSRTMGKYVVDSCRRVCVCVYSLQAAS